LATPGLPAQDRQVDIGGLDFQCPANAIRHRSGDQSGSRAKERIIYGIAGSGVIENRTFHELHRLLSPVSRRWLLLTAPAKGVPVGRFPERGLRTIPAPTRVPAAAYGVPARLVLPVFLQGEAAARRNFNDLIGECRDATDSGRIRTVLVRLRLIFFFRLLVCQRASPNWI